jgi:hypothetical protein
MSAPEHEGVTQDRGGAWRGVYELWAVNRLPEPRGSALPCRERLGDRWRSHVGWIKRAGAETRRMMVVGFWAGCDGGDRFRCRNEEWLGRVVTRSARGRGGGRSRERSRQEKEAPAGQGGGRRLRRRVGFVCGLLRIGWCWFVPDRRPCSVGWDLGADHGARAVAGAGFCYSLRPGRRAVGWRAGAPAGSRAVGGREEEAPAWSSAPVPEGGCRVAVRR